MHVLQFLSSHVSTIRRWTRLWWLLTCFTFSRYTKIPGSQHVKTHHQQGLELVSPFRPQTWSIFEDYKVTLFDLSRLQMETADREGERSWVCENSDLPSLFRIKRTAECNRSILLLKCISWSSVCWTRWRLSAFSLWLSFALRVLLLENFKEGSYSQRKCWAVT
jgi:hypothetical protein